MRIELDDENTKKAQEAEKQLRETYGLQASPNQIVNIFFAAIQSVELHRLIKMILTTSTDTKAKPEQTKVIKTSENWVMRF